MANRDIYSTRAIWILATLALIVALIAPLTYSWFENRGLSFVSHARQHTWESLHLDQTIAGVGSVLTHVEAYRESPTLEPLAKLSMDAGKLSQELTTFMEGLSAEHAKDTLFKLESIEELEVLRALTQTILALHTLLEPPVSPPKRQQLISMSHVLAQFKGHLSALKHMQNKQFQSEIRFLKSMTFYVGTLFPLLLLGVLITLILLGLLTQQKLATTAHHHEITLKGIQEALREMLIVTDKHANIQFISKSTQTALGFEAQELLGQPIARIVIGAAKERGLDYPLFRHMCDEMSSKDMHAGFRSKAGAEIPVKLNGQALLDGQQHAAGLLIVAQDMRYLKQHLETEQEFDKIKTDFISILSHELRSPLAVVKAAIDLLAMGKFDADKQKEIIERASTGAQRLTEVVGDLMDLAKTEAKMLHFEIQNAHLPNVVKQVVDLLSIKAKKSDVNLATSVSSALPPVKIDPIRTHQILRKLVENAMKYTPAGGNVQISADRYESDYVRVIVSDTGCGIPQEKLHRVFKKFEQVESSLTRAKDGTGLGIPLTKELVAIQGGTFWIESKVGLGTKACFTVPIAAEPIILEEAG